MSEATSAQSAFARRREENIAANKSLLNELSADAKKITPRPKPTPVKRAPRSTRSTPVKREAPLPTRKSSRLAGHDADNPTLKRKMEVEAQHQADQAKAKKMRRTGDLDLGDIGVEGKKWENGVGGLKGIIRGAQPGIRTFTEEDIKETTDKDLRELQSRMSGLELYSGWTPHEIKIVPQRAYALGFHPMEDKAVVFAGDKEGSVGVFDASQTAPEVDDDDEDADIPNPIITAFTPHRRTISSFVFPADNANAVYTSSYDSSIRMLDLEKEKSVQIFAPADVSDELPISALDMAHSDSNLLYFSTLDGGVGRCDLRAPKNTEIWTLSDQKIGGFSLHPLQPHLIATASLDRTLKIWDARKISGKGDLRHPTLLGEHNSRLSVSHASWSGGGQIATSSYDDTIKIYDFSEASKWNAGQDIPTKKMEPSQTVRHNNQTGRWVTILKPQWQRTPHDGIQKFVIGNMNRFVDVYASDGTQLAQLGGDGISAVPAVAHFHPTLDWVAGATASGKLCLWQ